MAIGMTNAQIGTSTYRTEKLLQQIISSKPLVNEQTMVNNTKEILVEVINGEEDDSNE